MSEHIIFSYEQSSEGGFTKVGSDKIPKLLKSKKLAWVHVDAEHTQTRKWMEEELGYLDPYTLDALLADETRPRVTQIKDGAIVILRGVNLNDDSVPEDMISIRLWVDSHRIISLQRRDLKAVQDLVDKIQAKKGPKDAGDFLCQLSSRMFERMEPVLSELDESTDDIEEKIMEDPDKSLRSDILEVRKKAIIFRRYISPQRDVLSYLRNSDLDWLSQSHKRHLQENYERVVRYVEDLDAIRERAQIVKDELVNVFSDRLNKNTYILSVIAAIFLPLGFLTGLLGINVGGIPGSDNPQAFGIFSGLLFLLVVLQIVLFKKLKWF